MTLIPRLLCLGTMLLTKSQNTVSWKISLNWPLRVIATNDWHFILIYSHILDFKKCDSQTALAKLILLRNHSLKAWHCITDLYNNDKHLLSLNRVLSAHTFRSEISKNSQPYQKKILAKSWMLNYGNAVYLWTS